MKLKIALNTAILLCICIQSSAQDLNWNTVPYTTGSLNANFGTIGSPAVSVSMSITGYTAGLPSSSPAKRIATPQAGTGTTCTSFCALRSAPTFSNPSTQSLILTFTFSPAITPLSFSLYDIDGAGGVIDSARVTASGPSGAQIVTMTNVNPATSNIFGSGTTTATVKGGTGNNTDAQTNVSISGVVSTLVLRFMGQGSFSIGNMFWISLLPVKWVSFSGSMEVSDVVKLNWKTESEENADHYEIERSKDGQHFTEIGWLAAQRGSSNTYLFTDTNPGDGNSYYRIRQVDRDGRFEFSTILLINPDKHNQPGFSITPNPASQFILINTNRNAPISELQIYDIGGRLVYSSTTGMNRVDVSRLNTGIYRIKIKTSNGEVFIESFLKK